METHGCTELTFAGLAETVGAVPVTAALGQLVEVALDQVDKEDLSGRARGVWGVVGAGRQCFLDGQVAVRQGSEIAGTQIPANKKVENAMQTQWLSGSMS